jgi:hypothetical protein
MSKSDCRVCLGPHDDAIHAATVGVHRWFRAQVQSWLSDSQEEPYEAIDDGDAPVTADVA